MVQNSWVGVEKYILNSFGLHWEAFFTKAYVARIHRCSLCASIMSCADRHYSICYTLLLLIFVFVFIRCVSA